MNEPTDAKHKYPFTIQLLYKSGSTTQPIALGVDTGSQHIGFAGVLVTEETVSDLQEPDATIKVGKTLFKTEIALRSHMEKRKLMETRRTYRRGRRYRKVRYRKPKFRHHTKRVYQDDPIKRKGYVDGEVKSHLTHWRKVPAVFQTGRQEGWLPPSVESKVMHHIAWINRYLDILPAGTSVRIELARFDIQRMRDPTIHGELYQKGPLYDYENYRAYAFARDDYTCQACHKKAGTIAPDGRTRKLVAHHIELKKEGATDRPDKILTVCTCCHTDAAHKPGGKLFDLFLESRKKDNPRGYRDPTMMNIVRNRLLEAYQGVAKFTYGNITAADRERFGLPKGHAEDAVAIAAHDLDVVYDDAEALIYRQVKSKKRSLHEATPRKGRKTKNTEAVRNAKNTKSAGEFHLWDKVSCGKLSGWISSFSNKGQGVRLKTIADEPVLSETEMAKPKKDRNLTVFNRAQIHLCNHNNNWICGKQYKGDSSRV